MLQNLLEFEGRLMVMAVLVAAVGQIIMVYGKTASTIKNLGNILKDDWHMANNGIFSLLNTIS